MSAINLDDQELGTLLSQANVFCCRIEEYQQVAVSSDHRLTADGVRALTRCYQAAVEMEVELARLGLGSDTGLAVIHNSPRADAVLALRELLISLRAAWPSPFSPLSAEHGLPDAGSVSRRLAGILPRLEPREVPAEQRSQPPQPTLSAPVPVPTTHNAGQQRPRRKRPNGNDARDKFIYDRLRKGHTLAGIRSELDGRSGWEILTSEQGISQAAKRYAGRHELPWPID